MARLTGGTGVVRNEPDLPSQEIGERVVAGLGQLVRYYEAAGVAQGAVPLAKVRFAEALARYRLAPPEGRLIRQRMHVAVFGGAGTGKSTVANLLVGAPAAQVNPQAGYTRHPVALFRGEEAGPDPPWPRCLGKLIRTDQPGPDNVDEDQFACRPLGAEIVDPGFLRRHVVWDGPDLTTKDSQHYHGRMIEIAALADVGVYVASDERYNDELPTNFLAGLLEAGKPVVVALTKAAAEDADELERLFREQVVAMLPHRERILDVVSIPQPLRGRVARLWTDEFPYGARLREVIERATGDFEAARHQGRRAAVAYLLEQHPRLLEPLRDEVGQWQAWCELVRTAANQAVRRYERDYLERVRYEDFEDLLSSLLALAEPAPRFHWLWQGLELARTPYRLLKTAWRRLNPRPPADRVEEESVLRTVHRGMLDQLLVACASRQSRHRFWTELRTHLESEADRADSGFDEARGRQRRRLDEQIAQSAQSVRQRIEASPRLLAALRAGRLAADLGAAGAVIALYAFGSVPYLVPALLLLLAALGLTEDALRLGLRSYLDRVRRVLIAQQKEDVRELIQTSGINRLLALPRSAAGSFAELARLADQLVRDLESLEQDWQERPAA